MFWGLIMEPQRRYTQSVKKAFHISMAAIDISSSDNEPTQVMCSFESRNYLLCTLQKGKIVQCPLDLNFEVGDKISFATNGNSHVHLTGYLTDEFDDIEEEAVDEEEAAESTQPKKRSLKPTDGPAGKKMKTAEMLEAINSHDSDDSDDVNFSDIFNDLEDDDEGEEEEDDDEDEDDNAIEEEDNSDIGDEEESDDDEEGEDEEDEEDESPQVNKKAKLVNGNTPTKKAKNAQVKKTEDTNKSPKPEKTKNQPSDKKQKQEHKQEAKTPKSPKDTPQPKKRIIEGGVIIEDLKQGDGPVAKPGKICQVYYEGRLKSNNKVFDSTNKGPGFKFRLGKQEVIKGWDVGFNGMKVGGKRRITCPANMAYGQKGSPPAIPPNATLIFDVELKGVL